MQGGQALAYSLANLDSQFRTTFTGYGTNSNVYFTRYRNWATAALDTIRGTLRAAGLQGSQLRPSRRFFRRCGRRQRQPNGAVRAIQVMTDIAEQQTQQLMKLRQIMLADLSSKQAYQAAVLQQDAANKAATEQFFTNSARFERWPDIQAGNPLNGRWEESPVRWMAAVVGLAAIFGTVGCQRTRTAKRDSAEGTGCWRGRSVQPRPRIPSGSGSDSIGPLPWR